MSCALFVGLLTLIAGPVARAQEVQVEVAQAPMGFTVANTETSDTGWEDKTIEPSGVVPIGDSSLLLVACDKNENLIVVEAATGRVKQWLGQVTLDKRPKWEDLAYDDEGTLYVVGSRLFEDRAEVGAQKKLMAVARLLRFRLRSVGADGTSLVIDPESIDRWDISEALAAEGSTVILGKTKSI